VTAVGGIELVCPRCRGFLEERVQEFHCAECSRAYPVVAGIPDMRVTPDPWIGIEKDRDKALRVLGEAEGLDFEGHVRTYWRLTSSTAPGQAERFVDHVLHAPGRSREWLELHGEDVAEGEEGPWLDAGCGTCDLTAVAPAGMAVVGIDVAMRWLVIARRRLLELGRECHLVCANAEALPFPDGTFGRFFSLGMLEHCSNLEGVACEAHRVLRPGGLIRARTLNRYTLLTEPHVGLCGVGYLPRRWANRYVRWRSGTGYEHHHPWSVSDLDRALRRAGFRDVHVGAAATLECELDRAGRVLRSLAPGYEVARRFPVVRKGVDRVAPLLAVEGVA
jgi:SAM-dependent methyltransferase